MAAACNISSTGRDMTQRRGVGFLVASSWTLTLSGNSTTGTWTSLLGKPGGGGGGGYCHNPSSVILSIYSFPSPCPVSLHTCSSSAISTPIYHQVISTALQEACANSQSPPDHCSIRVGFVQSLAHTPCQSV